MNNNNTDTPSNEEFSKERRVWDLPNVRLDESTLESLKASYEAFASSKDHDRELIGYIPPDE